VVIVIVVFSQTLPFHLLLANSRYRLKCVLTEPEVFLFLHQSQRRHQLRYYWQQIKARATNSSTAATDEYVRVLLREHAEYGEPLPSSSFQLLQKVGSFLRSLEEYEGAERFLRAALSLAERDHPHSVQLAKAYYLLAQLHWNQGHWTEAEAHVTPAQALYTALLGEDDLEVARCLCGLGEIKLYKEPEVARPLLERALRIRRAKLGNDHALVSRILHDLALIHDQFGEHQHAVALHLEAIGIRKRVLGDRHPQLAVSWENLGSTYQVGSGWCVCVCSVLVLSVLACA
jgi:tetratricopeptide (TPR) repeat protein